MTEAESIGQLDLADGCLIEVHRLGQAVAIEVASEDGHVSVALVLDVGQAYDLRLLLAQAVERPG